MKPRRGAARLALATTIAATAIAAGCGDDSDETSTTAAGAGTSGADLTAVKDYLTEHTAELSEQTAILNEQRAGVLRPRRVGRLRLRGADGRARRRGRAPALRVQGRLRRGQPRLRGDGGHRRRRSAPRPVRRGHRRRLRRLRPRERGVVQPRPARTARRSSSRATCSSSPRRRSTAPIPTSSPSVAQDVDGDGKEEFGEGVPDANILLAGDARSSTSQAKSLDADAQAFEPTAVRRVHGADDHDPDDERVLRDVEEHALRRRRGRDRAGVRRQLAPLGHRRHPRGPRLHLRRDRAA